MGGDNVKSPEVLMTLREKYEALISAWSVDPEDADVLDMIKENMSKLNKYVEQVYEMETSIKLLSFRYEGQEFRDRVETLDRNRRYAHERAIVAVTQLNRWATMMKVEPMFTGDIEDRYQVADFCMEVVKEFFDTRMGNEEISKIVKEV